ncbi:MAG: hypothetical protein GYA21_11405 [Myxococcales bacterium]|nr:hypothetical protein [Myxococcales bacterium]
MRIWKPARAIFAVAFLGGALAQGANLQGKVTRSDTNAPVENAQVQVRGTPFQAASGADGSYLILNIPDGAFGLTCSAPGLRGTSTGAVDLTGNVTRDFALSPPPADTAAISGTTTCAGTPCGKVLVQAQRNNEVRGRALSAPDGSYSIEGLSAGSYAVQAVAYGHLPARASAEITTVPDAGPAGATLDLELTPAPGGFTLSGAVGLSDNPLDRSGSQVRCNGQTPALQAVTAASGAYSLANVPAGFVSLTASRSGYNPQTQIDVLVEANLTQNFVLSKGGGGPGPTTYVLSGTVRESYPDGGAPDGGVVTGPTRVGVWSADGTFRITVTANADLTYRVSGIPAGTYQAGASREGFITQVSDPFDMNANRTLDLTLEYDPEYVTEPPTELPGCSCRTAAGSVGLLSLALALMLCGLHRKGR